MGEIEDLERAFDPLPKTKTLADTGTHPFAHIESSSIAFEPDRIVKRPVLAAKIALIANCWTALEMELGETLAHLLKTQPEVGLAIWESIRSFDLRRKVVGKAGLEEKPRDVLHQLLLKSKHLYDVRINVEHGLWGVPGFVRDALIRVNPQDALEYRLKRWRHRTEPQQWFFGPTPHIPPNLIEVWYESDFMALADQLKALAFLFESFRHWLAFPNADSRDAWRRRLCTLPPIAAVLSPPPAAPRNRPKRQRKQPP